MRASEMTMPSATGSAPPERPVPAPRATNGIACAAQARTTACTCSVVSGRQTSPGITRRPVSPSHSYVRSSSCSVSTAPGGSAASTASVNARGSPTRVSLCPWLRRSRPAWKCSRTPARRESASSRRRPSPSSPRCSASSGRAGRSCSSGATSGRQRIDAGELPDFLTETQDVRDDPDLARRLRAGRPPGPPRRDHRARRPQDGDQRAQLGREGLHGRLRGRELAHVDELRRGPVEPHRRRRAHDLARHGREAVQPERRDRDAARPPARLAPAREARHGRRRARVRRPLRLRPLHVPLGRAAAERRVGAVLLPPQAREPPRGAALERRVRPRPGHARPAAGDDPRHRPHRDDPRGVRDGGDPLRAARPLGGAQRRPLGLHVQRHQEVPRPAGVRPPRPAARDDDGAVHARVHRAAREDVPPARGARDRRHGRVHPLSARPRGERRRAGEGHRGQAARGRRRLRRHLGRASRPRADGEGGVRRGARLAREPGRAQARRRRRDGRRSCSTWRRRPAT